MATIKEQDIVLHTKDANGNPVIQLPVTRLENVEGQDTKLVHTTGNETVAGTKTFSSSPIAPTPTAGDNSTKVATTAFVKALGDTKAPTSHASSATTYGIGTGSNYGHVKLSDSTSSTSAASAGIAATPKAVKAAYDLANTANTTANTKAADSAVVKLTGDQTIAGTKTFTSEILTQHTIDDAKTVPNENQYHTAMVFRDKKGQAFGHLQTASYADTGDLLVKMSVVDGLRQETPDATTHFIGIGMDANGTPYTLAPTPPANDDSTQIATTQWVGDNNAGSATKLKTARTIRTNLASTSTASFDGSGNVTPGVTGTLPIGNGGTGLTANPSMLINLASTTAANVLAASPRPGVTGVLPIANGGTGSSTKNFVDLTSAQSIAGTKTFTGAIKAGVDALISHSDDASAIRIDGGSGWNLGASLLLYGKSEASYAGAAKIRVSNGTNSPELYIKPDGTMQWNSKNVVRSVNGTSADASGNVAISVSTPTASSSTMGGIKPASAWVKILESTSNIGTYSYTATKNCFVCAYNMGGTNNMTVMAAIGGVTIYREYTHHNDGNMAYPMLYLSKGQTITITQNSAKLHFSVLYLE